MLMLGVAELPIGPHFLAVGAWPVMGFLGLEILALWLVFRFSFRAQRARTYVRVTAESVDVRKVDGWGRSAAPASARTSPASNSTAGPKVPMPCGSPRPTRAYVVGEFLDPARARNLRPPPRRKPISDARRERHTGDNR